MIVYLEFCEEMTHDHFYHLLQTCPAIRKSERLIPLNLQKPGDSSSISVQAKGVNQQVKKCPKCSL